MWSYLLTSAQTTDYPRKYSVRCMIPSLPWVSVGRPGCKLFGGIASMLNSTMFGTGVSRVRLYTITDIRVECSIRFTSISMISSCPIRRSWSARFPDWQHESSRDLAPCPLLCCYVQSQWWVKFDSFFTPRPNNSGYHSNTYATSWRWAVNNI